MDHLPRLHPDDLKELSKSISGDIKNEIKSIFAKEESISKIQTFTVKEAARILQKSDSTILRYLDAKILIGSRPGKEWIITQANLSKFINGE